MSYQTSAITRWYLRSFILIIMLCSTILLNGLSENYIYGTHKYNLKSISTVCENPPMDTTTKDPTDENDVGLAYNGVHHPWGRVNFHPGESISIVADVMNFGTNDQTSPFDVKLVIYNNSDWSVVYEQTETVSNLPAGNMTSVTFPAWTAPSWSAPPDIMTFTVNVTTMLVGDTNPANDDASVEFYIFDLHDVAVAVVTPVQDTLIHTNTEVVVNASLANLGTFDETNIGITCNIINSTGGTVYTASHTVTTLGAGNFTRFPFIPSWITPAYEDNLTIQLTMTLAGDENSENDMDTIIVKVGEVYDLMVKSIELSPTGPYDVNTNIELLVTIENNGNLPVNDFDVDCIIYDPDNVMVYHDTVTSFSISPEYGSQVTCMFYWTTPTITIEQSYNVVTEIPIIDENISNNAISRSLLIDPCYDVGIDALWTYPSIPPSGVFTPGSLLNINATVRNYGGLSHTNINVACEIKYPDDTIGFSTSTMIELLSGYATAECTFEQHWLIPKDNNCEGYYIINVSVELLNDEMPDNNYNSLRIQVKHFIDVGVKSIDHPVTGGKYGLGKMVLNATIMNFGTQTIQNLWVEYMLKHSAGTHVLIADSYCIQQLLAGSSVKVEFEYVFDTLGDYNVTFITKLADMNSKNDMKTVKFKISIETARPIARINSPTEGNEYLTTEKIYFDAFGSYDPDDDLNSNGKIDGDEIDHLSYYWVSNIDGGIGYTPTFVTRALDAGNHEITLYVSDGYWNISASVNITVHGSEIYTYTKHNVQVSVCYKVGERIKVDIVAEQEPSISAPSTNISLGLYYNIMIETVQWAWANVTVDYTGVDKTLLAEIDELHIRIWTIIADQWRLFPEHGIDTDTNKVWSIIDKFWLPQLSRASTTTTSMRFIGVFGPKKVETYGALGGYVNDLHGYPLLGVNITVLELELYTITDHDGYYYFELVPVGIYTVTASKYNYYLNQTFNVQIQRDIVVNVDFVLTAYGYGTIEGSVTDLNTTNPIEAAIIRVDGTALEAITDAAGKYTITNIVVGYHNVVANKSGYHKATKVVNVQINKVTILNFELRPTQYNHAPELRAPQVTPASGDDTTWFTFTVIYIDPDGDEPYELGVRLILDSRPYPMVAKSEQYQYTQGIRYEYRTKLSAGKHTFRFDAKDRWGAPATGEGVAQMTITVKKAPGDDEGWDTTTGLQKLFSTSVGLGVIAIIIATIVGIIAFLHIQRIKKRKIEEEEALKKYEPSAKMCPSCGAMLPKGVTKCSRCNRDIERKVIEYPCPGCGKLNPATTTVCTGCGRELYIEKLAARYAGAPPQAQPQPPALRGVYQEAGRELMYAPPKDTVQYKPEGARARMWETARVPEAGTEAKGKPRAKIELPKVEGVRELPALPAKQPLKRDIRCPSCSSIVKAGETLCTACGEDEFGTLNEE